MSHRKDLPSIDRGLLAELASMSAAGAVFNTRFDGAVLRGSRDTSKHGALVAISALADGATGEELLQTIKLWKSSHDQGFQNMRECHSCQAQPSAHASVVQPTPKTFAELSGPERAALKKQNPARYTAMRSEWLKARV